jgi:hypothetical protein
MDLIELRQYTLHLGQRDTLIELFEREFVETQEAVGLRVLGQFRDLDSPDRFVWLRGFADMAARRQGLEAFYGGPVWARHRDAANATMLDSDNVLLLKPAWEGSAFGLLAPRAPVGAGALPAGLLDATVFHLREPAGAALLELARGPMSRLLREAGALALGWHVNETRRNDFPRLPVRENEPVLVGFALFPDAHAHEAFIASGRWQREIAPQLSPHLARPNQSLRLQPTARSAIRA